MKFGFYLPTRGHSATPEALETLVPRGEALGCYSVSKLGVSELIFDFRSESLERMEHYANVIKPAADHICT